jgi:Protein required for biogenesis of the 60S ribosomal subunit
MRYLREVLIEDEQGDGKRTRIRGRPVCFPWSCLLFMIGISSFLLVKEEQGKSEQATDSKQCRVHSHLNFKQSLLLVVVSPVRELVVGNQIEWGDGWWKQNRQREVNKRHKERKETRCGKRNKSKNQQKSKSSNNKDEQRIENSREHKCDVEKEEKVELFLLTNLLHI